jgi:hypothetical protein
MKITSAAPVKFSDREYTFKAAIFTSDSIYLSNDVFVFADAQTLCKEVLKVGKIDERFSKLSDKFS